uniref:Uncharacterized protein n=1 Tax=Anguilla anguilla TaxID=7936 RepID=A0A0E9TF63_ANGAN
MGRRVSWACRIPRFRSPSVDHR